MPVFRRGVAVLLACASVLGITPVEAGTLRRGLTEPIVTLDPQSARTPATRLIARELFVGLVGLDAQRRPVPGAAQSWEMRDGGLVHVFRLRPEGRWSNGDPVVAGHFVAAFRRLATLPDGPGRHLLRAVANGEAVAAGRAPADTLGVEAIDDLTLRIRLEAPRSSLAADLADVAFSPIHLSSFESDRRPLVGNGPYRVAYWTPGAELSLNRNPHFREQAAVEAVQYRSLGRASGEAANLYRRGELDVAPVGYQDLAWAQENAPDELQSSDIQAASYAVIAGNDGAWGRSLEARAALALALDRAALTRSVSPPGLRPLDTLLPGRVAGYAPEVSPERTTPPAERRARAAELLSSAPGPLSEIRLCTDAERGPSRRQVLAVGLLWHLALGVKPVAAPHGNAGAACDVRLVTITTDVADPLTALEALTDEVRAETAPVVARHLRAAAAEADPRVRAERLREAERTLLADCRVIPLWQEVAHVLVKPRVTGWQASDPHRPTRFLATAD